MTYFRCKDRHCGAIHRDGRLMYDDGIFTMKGFCPDCGDQVEELGMDERVCDECEKALALPDDDLCASCRDLEDEKEFDLETIDIPSAERRHRDLMDTIVSIARGAQIPEEIES